MLNVVKGERVKLSGDSAELWIADYNVRVDSYATVMEKPAPRAKKVLVTIDSIDGDSNVTTYVRCSRVMKLPGSYPDFFPGGAESFAQRCADKICGMSMCCAPFDCHLETHRKQTHWRKMGALTECPLAQYHVTPKPDDRPWWLRSVHEMEPTQMELTAICAICPHGHVTIENNTLTVSYEDYATACVDCPVKAVMETIQEAQAEADMS